MDTLALSRRAALLKPSPTLAITGKAKHMRAQGIDVISFAAGEPDFNTPEPINRAAVEALEAGFTKYTPSAGIQELKEAIVEKLGRENGVQASPENVVVSCGAKHSVFNSLQVLLDPGDEVVLIAPYWMTYADQVLLAGGTPVIVKTQPGAGFVPSVESIREKITPRTKAIVVNSPCNPTGAVFPRQTVKEIAALALRHGLWIISDEIYERLIYGQEHQSFAALGREVAAQTITVGGCSKSYAMTGWRIGFACAPTPVAKAMSNFQDQVTSNPTSFAQKGAVVAFRLPAEAVEGMRAEFEARRNLIVGLLRGIEGVEVPEPSGAFYAFPNVGAFLQGRISTDLELAEYLLEEAHIAVVPGSVFEGPGHLRLSYAASRVDIERGVERLAGALAQIRA
ncbi:MAG TPA: pyridoxal phosphate-dependent aminotransferase [Fimbriimonadaceae bacterium]|nr:pyridoxal phosphate-dependent aminotransferase [Fimbriimonadaceae bacterium]